jgi:peptidoglycan/xylan/chitin deacetylase (PgdA/CDA1 family)/GT2 family glycosyltransferase
LADVPDISLIIPVHDNAGTIRRTLQSVQAQSHGGWEAIVVDDGSKDRSAAIAARMAQGDRRITVIRQSNTGASGARNSGLSHASGRWIIFLDADDVLSPDHLATMLAAAKASPQAGLLHCGWRRWRHGKRWLREYPAQEYTFAFAEAAKRPPFAIHSAMTRSEHIRDAGGFDPALKICEDWDLWQRIARLGVRFVPVENLWAEVHVRPRSLSADRVRHLSDGLTVIARGHAPDPRVSRASPEYAQGSPEQELVIACWWHALWVIGASVGQGGDPLPLLESVEMSIGPAFATDVAATILEDGITVGACWPEPVWPALWAKVKSNVGLLTDWFDHKQPGTLLGRRIAARLHANIARQIPADVTATIGDIHQQTIDLDRPIPDLRLPGVSHFLGIIGFEQREVARFERLVFGGISASEIAKEIVKSVDPAELGRILAKPRLSLRSWRGSHLRQSLRNGAASVPDDVISLLGTQPSDGEIEDSDAAFKRIVAEEYQRALPAPKIAAPSQDAAPMTGPAIGEDVDYTQESYWEGIFSNKDPWDYRNNYEAVKYDQTIDLIADRRYHAVLEIACAEGEFTRRLATLGDEVLATDIAPSAVARAAEQLRDLPNVDTRRLDLLTEDLPGRFDLIVCSEVLYYLDDAEMLARFAAKISAHLNPGGVFVTAHANLLVDEPYCTGFGWPHEFGSKGIGEVFSADLALAMTSELWTPLYRIQRFEKVEPAGSKPETQWLGGHTAHPLPPRVAGQVRWRGAYELPNAGEWHDFPILMYHRIADEGPPGLARWRTGPTAFETQIKWLRDNGWHGITFDRMVKALHWEEALPENSVMLTFDDATRDFLDHALPILHRYQFPATLCVPAGKVGQSADWDDWQGDPAPLLDWPELEAIGQCDVAIVAHGMRHLSLPALSQEDLVRDLAGAKATLEERLGKPVNAIAYPFGDFDPHIKVMAKRMGYQFGFTCFGGMVTERSDPLVLQRQEVNGGIDLDAFSALLRA